MQFGNLRSNTANTEEYACCKVFSFVMNQEWLWWNGGSFSYVLRILQMTSANGF
jgi:hypothetical protein